MCLFKKDVDVLGVTEVAPRRIGGSLIGNGFNLLMATLCARPHFGDGKIGGRSAMRAGQALIGRGNSKPRRLALRAK